MDSFICMGEENSKTTGQGSLKEKKVNVMDRKEVSPNKCSLWRITTGAVLLFALYTVVAVFFPAAENPTHKLMCILLLLFASYKDIREKHYSLLICLGLILVNALHTFINAYDFTAWITGAAVSFALLVIYLFNHKIIGLGDIILLGLCVAALPNDTMLVFLFFSFFLSSIYGLIFGISKRKMKNLTVPMVPCITLAFIASCFI